MRRILQRSQKALMRRCHGHRARDGECPPSLLPFHPRRPHQHDKHGRALVLLRASCVRQCRGEISLCLCLCVCGWVCVVVWSGARVWDDETTKLRRVKSDSDRDAWSIRSAVRAHCWDPVGAAALRCDCPTTVQLLRPSPIPPATHGWQPAVLHGRAHAACRR